MGALLLPLCVVVFFGVMALKMSMAPPDTRPRTAKERLEYVRIVVAALLLLITIGYRLQRTSHEIDGKGTYKPGIVEQIVTKVSDLLN